MSISSGLSPTLAVPGRLALEGIDHIELYVGNAQQAAHFYCTAFGFARTAYAGLETGLEDRASIVVEQGDIRLVLTSPLRPVGHVAEHVGLHGDGVRDVAFRVDDAARAFDESVRRGAQPIREPAVAKDENGSVVIAAIKAYGDTIHSFVERRNYRGPFLPNYVRRGSGDTKRTAAGLLGVDHYAVNVEQGSLEEWAGFYKEVLGFKESQQQDISTEYSAMNIKVVQDDEGKIRFPIVEPATGKRKSQIQEFLDFNRGCGVQHIAMTSENIIGTTGRLRANGVDFVDTPATYYDCLRERIGPIDEELMSLRDLKILIDRDNDGYLMQIFTRPVQSRPTLFLEVIQRKGASGFGEGNIKALFEAVERDQAKRGTL
jgi:4-hydroxyphenylpyruvate dioxygenase